MKRNMILSLILGASLSAAALYLAFRHVPFRDLFLYLDSVTYLWIVPATAVSIVSFILRVFRWQIILKSTRGIPFWDAFHPMMIGFMMNCILPGRAGEVGRPLILQQRSRVPFTTGLATVAAERVFDISLLIAFFIVVLAFVDIDPSLNIRFGQYQLTKQTLDQVLSGMLKLCLTMMAGIALVAFQRTREWISRIIRSASRLFRFAGPAFQNKIDTRIAQPLARILDNVATGFSMLKYPFRIVACYALTTVVWILMGFSYYLMACGCPGIDRLSFLEISAVMIIVCFFIALPSVPGFWGLWEAGGVFALALFGISTMDAAGFTLLNHVIQMFPVILIGLISALITGINFWHVTIEKRELGDGKTDVRPERA